VITLVVIIGFMLFVAYFIDQNRRDCAELEKFDRHSLFYGHVYGHVEVLDFIFVENKIRQELLLAVFIGWKPKLFKMIEDDCRCFFVLVGGNKVCSCSMNNIHDKAIVYQSEDNHNLKFKIVYAKEYDKGNDWVRLPVFYPATEGFIQDGQERQRMYDKRKERVIVILSTINWNKLTKTQLQAVRRTKNER
jgi:hypothetical protein